MQKLIKILDKIDKLFASYKPGEIHPDKLVKDIFKDRAKQQNIFKEVIQLANEGLKQFPYNTELIRRRALARTMLVTQKGEYPQLIKAEKDFRTILKLDPNNQIAALDLLELMYDFSVLEDEEIAKLSAHFAQGAENVLLNLRSLEIKALAYANKIKQARAKYDHWSKLFPNSKYLKEALKIINDFSIKK